LTPISLKAWYSINPFKIPELRSKNCDSAIFANEIQKNDIKSPEFAKPLIGNLPNSTKIEENQQKSISSDKQDGQNQGKKLHATALVRIQKPPTRSIFNPVLEINQEPMIKRNIESCKKEDLKILQNAVKKEEFLENTKTEIYQNYESKKIYRDSKEEKQIFQEVIYAQKIDKKSSGGSEQIEDSDPSKLPIYPYS